MLFLNIVFVPFNATFPALNMSREACSIEVEISGHAASLHHHSRNCLKAINACVLRC